MTESASLDITRGEDWATQIVWTDQGTGRGIPVVHPCQLDIISTAGAVVASLVTDPDIPDGEIAGISLARDIGLIQLYLPKSVTMTLPVGVAKYDLFVSVDDPDDAYAGTQTYALLRGAANIHQNVTEMS